jgi:hypothetical protein
MTKLQMIERANGSCVFSVNIPLEIIEEIGWGKGIELLLETKKIQGNSIIIIFRKEEKINLLEEKNDSTI